MNDLADQVYFEIAAARKRHGGNKICGWERLVPYADPSVESDKRRETAFRAGVHFAEWLAMWSPAKFTDGMLYYFKQGNPFNLEN